MAPVILLVEDDAAFRKALAKLLKNDGFTPREAGTGQRGIAEALKDPPDLVILDMVLPGIGGKEVCQALKQEVRTAGIPILILTGEDKEGQEVSCLDMGADDYLTKPVKPALLLAHCRALLRRPPAPPQGPRGRLKLQDLHLDYAEKAATMAGRRIGHLTPKEFGVLYDLALNHPKPRDRVSLYKEVWGMDPPSEGSLKTVEVHVRRIRIKMAWGPGEWLVSVPARGYTLNPPPA